MGIFELLTQNANYTKLAELETKLDKFKNENLINNYSFIESTYLEINDEIFFKLNEVDDYLDELNIKKRIQTNKAICACGSELVVNQYKGYYESFKYLSCQNDKCDFLENQRVNGEKWNGQYS